MNLAELKRAKANTLATLEALDIMISQAEAAEKPKQRRDLRSDRSSKNRAKILDRLNKHNHLHHALELQKYEPKHNPYENY